MCANNNNILRTTIQVVGQYQVPGTIYKHTHTIFIIIGKTKYLYSYQTPSKSLLCLYVILL